jgi:hypothetical protein
MTSGACLVCHEPLAGPEVMLAVLSDALADAEAALADGDLVHRWNAHARIGDVVAYLRGICSLCVEAGTLVCSAPLCSTVIAELLADPSARRRVLEHRAAQGAPKDPPRRDTPGRDMG